MRTMKCITNNAATGIRKEISHAPDQPKKKAWAVQPYPPLDLETRSHVETPCAAFHINRKPQTLRKWACYENGPIRPIRINGRLAWPVETIARLLNGGE